MKGMINVDTGIDGKSLGGMDDGGGPGDPRGGSTYFSCIEGVCQEDDDGIYPSFSSCQESCEPAGPPAPPVGPDDGDDRGGDGRGGDDRKKKEDSDKKKEEKKSSEEEICKKGTYWCESRKACIPLKEKC
jgi:hypothetical protein